MARALKRIAAVLALALFASPALAQCCKVCSTSKPCGNSCISATKTCRKPPGCACGAGAGLGLLAPAPLKSKSVPPRPTKAKPGKTAKAPAIRVIDGDSFILAGREVRLDGIDAPELDQTCLTAASAEYPCGQGARRALAMVIDTGGAVTCRVTGLDRYGRDLAKCRAGRLDINDTMVRHGWAFAFVRYSRDYAGAEQAARAARLGIFDGEAEPPWVWRKSHED